MITYGHVDVKYVHYGLDFYPGDANHTVGSVAKLLEDLEKLPTSSFCALFEGFGTTSLYEALLAGNNVCLTSLENPLNNPFLVNNCHQLCISNLIVVQRTTNINMYSIVGCCSKPKGFSRRSLILS